MEEAAKLVLAAVHENRLSVEEAKKILDAIYSATKAPISVPSLPPLPTVLSFKTCSPRLNTSP